jgi:hypothetical protein
VDKTYRVQVFGKAGCRKCADLKRRLGRLLRKPEWADFEEQYCDIETEPGLVAFAKAQCVNPGRIPAMLVLRHDPDSGRYRPLEVPEPGKTSELFGDSRLYHFLGLQTDYSGTGVLRPDMIEGILREAKAS